MNRTGMIWAVLAAVIVIILAFYALRPATEVAGDAAEQSAPSTTQAMDRDAARAEAVAELTALRVRAEAGETYAELSDDLAQVRARAAGAYENAEGAAAEEWADISAGFDAFEASARAGTSTFLDAFTSLIARFSADVRTEEPGE